MLWVVMKLLLNSSAFWTREITPTTVKSSNLNKTYRGFSKHRSESYNYKLAFFFRSLEERIYIEPRRNDTYSCHVKGIKGKSRLSA